jgi:hypothetical protein
MKGTLKYLEPVEEVGYKGGWVINIPTEKPYNNIFKPCSDTMRWIEENDTPTEMEVEFTVFCNCHYDEETNTARHGLLAKINNV